MLVAVSILSAAAFAHSGATGVVKQRMELMQDIGEAMKSLADMFKGKTPYDSVQVRAQAEVIRDRAGQHILELFPHDSVQPPSEALPDIWSDWASFEALAIQLRDYSDALAQAADNPSGPGMLPGGTPDQGGMGGGRGMMLGRGPGMMSGGRGAGMMGGAPGAGPDPSHLAEMPPQAAFMHVAETCNSCHTRFRLEQE